MTCTRCAELREEVEGLETALTAPHQDRIIEALHKHDRALLLTPGGIGRRTAIVHALPDEGPILWITSRGMVETIQGYVAKHRPGLLVRVVTKRSLSKDPPDASFVAGGTLVLGGGAGRWLGKGSKRCLAVRGLATVARRAWAHGSSLSEPASAIDCLLRIKFDLGLDFAPLAAFDNVISLGWTEARSQPPEFDPQPLLEPIDLDALENLPIGVDSDT